MFKNYKKAIFQEGLEKIKDSDIKIILLSGIPGSGKTTFTKKFKNNHNYEIFASDEYRKKLFGDESIQGDPNLVFGTLYSDLEEGIKKGKICIIDIASNSSLKNRKRFYDKINLIRKKLNKNHIMINIIDFIIDPNLSYLRDKEREKKVGLNIIRSFYGKSKKPSKDEITNGKITIDIFDYYIKINEKNKKENQIINKKRKGVKILLDLINNEKFEYSNNIESKEFRDIFFKLKNNIFPLWGIWKLKINHLNCIYHKESVLEHIFNVFMNSFKIKGSQELKIATFFHDLGKFYKCYNHVNKKGININNFNGHEESSLKIFLSYKKYFFKYIKTSDNLNFDLIEKMIGLHGVIDYIDFNKNINDINDLNEILRKSKSWIKYQEITNKENILDNHIFSYLLQVYVCDKFGSINSKEIKNQVLKKIGKLDQILGTNWEGVSKNIFLDKIIGEKIIKIKNKNILGINNKIKSFKKYVLNNYGEKIKIYYVGGSIKDLLLGKNNNDINILINLSLKKTEKYLKNYFGINKVFVENNKKMEIIKLKLNMNKEKISINITNFKKENILQENRKIKIVLI